DLPLYFHRRFLLIHLPELFVCAHGTELPDSLRAELGAGLGLGRRQQPILLARRRKRAQNAALHVHVGRRAVDLGQRGAAFAAAVRAEVLDGPALELGRRAALRDAGQNLAGPRTVHLREHVERLALQPRRTGAAQLLLDDG